MEQNKESTNYFKHDLNARNDIHLSTLMVSCKDINLSPMEVYGVYFVVLEILRGQSNWKICNNRIGLTYISREVGLPIETIKKFFERASSKEYRLFEKTDEYIYSKRLLSDMEEYSRKLKQYKKAGIRSGEVRREIAAKRNTTQQKRSVNKTGSNNKKEPPTYPISARFHALWKEYCSEMGDPNNPRVEEFSKIVRDFGKDNEQFLFKELMSAIKTKSCPTFMKDIYDKQNNEPK